MLEAKGLTFEYPGGQSLSFPDIELASNDQLLILGPSGCGKSTLLSLLAGLLSPKQGFIKIGGQALSSLTGASRDRWRGQHVGLVFQQPRLVASQTIRDNIELPLKLFKANRDQKELDEAMLRLGIQHLGNKLPEHCSLGEQQRAGILRALIHKPAIILADEPTSALDEDNAIKVAQLLKREAEQAKAMLLVVTHDARLQNMFSRKLSLTNQVNSAL